MLSLILATDQKGLIGVSHSPSFKNWYHLPWYYPNDLKRFKQLTTNKIIVMGRRTFECLNSKPLPNRRNIVISNSLADINGIEVTNDIEYIKQLGKDSEVFIIGGKTIFELFNPIVETIFLTKINSSFYGDVFFNLDLKDFYLVSNIELGVDDEHFTSYEFQTYVRNKN